MLEVRPFARRDREQLSHLVNAHVAAATPGGAVPAAMLLNDMERPVGEDIVAPWVTDVVTLVALHHDRLVGAAHLRRYTDDDRASESYRDAGEIAWLVCWPDHLEAGRAVRDQSIARLGEWGVRIYYGDGAFPAHVPHISGRFYAPHPSACSARRISAASSSAMSCSRASSSWLRCSCAIRRASGGS